MIMDFSRRCQTCRNRFPQWQHLLFPENFKF